MVHLAAGIVCASIFAAAASADDFRIEVAFPNLRFDKPVCLGHAPGDGSEHGLLYVLEQDGVVRVFENRRDVERAGVALDIRGKVLREGWEEGLLGMAFHPKFAENRQVYLCYSAANPRRNVYSVWTMDASGQRIDPASESVFLEVPQPWANHNGGGIEFGPDGFLYITLGDGGSGGDPRNAGQRLDTLLGKILRIDVDRRDPGLRYAIPEDNPFVAVEGARPEIWAYGLRNAWRFSFDSQTGELWAGDVGQNKWEEIDLVVKGGNYGWRVREGKHPFSTRDDATGPFIDPIVDHPRSEAVSITGGYVYRGKAIPSLVGAYIYGDFGTRRIWALRYDSQQQKVLEHREIGLVNAIASFGVDRDQELYICSHDGRIYKFVPAE